MQQPLDFLKFNHYNGIVKIFTEDIIMLDIKVLGNRIKELRKKNGLTQAQFAEELHVCFQAVSNWERGIAPPELENLIRIACCFNVLVDDLLRPDPRVLILGVDGGGTKTEFAVTTMEGQVLRQFTKPGSNPNDIGFEKALGIVSDGIREALLEFPSIRCVCCGISGILAGNYRAQMTERLEQKYPSLKIGVQSDSANLFGMDDEAGMAVISGTGSVVFVKNGEETIRLGGWGYLFDSAGSAYDIGRDAVTATLAQEDAGDAPSLMSRLLLEKLGKPTAWSAIGTLYDKGKPFIASLANVVFEAYREGDTKAIEIIDQSAKRLGELLTLGIEKYHARPCAIASGGIFEHHADVLLPHLTSYTDTEIVICDLPPIYGACRQAHKMLETEVSESFHKNFKISSKGMKK